MINLMPTEAKSAIAYARRNLRLLHWTFGIVAIIIAMGGTVIVGGFYIDNSKSNLSKSIEQTKQAIATQKLDEVKTEASNLSSGVKLIVSVLNKEVRFSKLLQQIGALIPTNATLGNVQLSNKITGAIDLTINAVDYNSATQAQVNLQDTKNSLFDKVDTVSVSCDDTSLPSDPEKVSKYKCQTVVRAQFKPDAAVTFLSGDKK